MRQELAIINGTGAGPAPGTSPKSPSGHTNARGRRLPSHQAPDRLIPEGLHASGFDDAMLLYDASSKGSLSFVSRMLTCSRSSLELFLQRSPPRLFTAAAWSGL